MKTILSDKLPRILKNKKNLEKNLKVKITHRGKEVIITGKPEDEYVAEKIIDALNFGFPFANAMLIKTEDFLFEIINIKDHTKRGDLKSVRARLIGTQGQTLQNLTKLSESYFEIKDNQIGIIAPPENMGKSQEAVISIIRGSKQGNVYKFLEKNQNKPIGDLGLKE